MIKIRDMKCGNDNVEFTAMISHVTTGKTNGANKSNYLSIVFQDETGTIDAKLWNATDEQISTLQNGAVVRGKGDIIKYSDDRQMKIVKIEDISYQQSQQVQFLSKAPMDQDEMIEQLMSYVKRISNTKLYVIVKHLMEKNIEALKIYPAASRNHHECVSGLAYHTLSMLKLADSMLDFYPSLNADLMYAGILLHDLGKTVELSGPVVPTYTLEGKMLGHISIAQAMVYEAAKELNIEGEEVVLLQHLILSHHGKNEFGSPVLPQIKEAEMIYLIDNIDARMNMFDKALDQVEPGEYSKRVFALENRTIYKPKMYE
ncbi:MAG: HD domain-containing protein [Longibaculum muris]|uniref:HD domain-containing protein n=1 Tax=Longibaculum muris TaxID=1796628 RepID=UPI002E7A1345|nr:HD domain-containing protein [Longibaculum muris]MED9811306.1 HD domain-containing protein [Longibaculum muris]